MAGKKSAPNKLKRKAGNGKAAVKAAPKKLPTIKDPMSKMDMIRTLTEVTGLNRGQVVSVLDHFTLIIEKHLKPGGPGVFVFPGILKATVIKKPARPARKGINPFTGQEIMIKAKPASKAVKVKALKKLKEMVA